MCIVWMNISNHYSILGKIGGASPLPMNSSYSEQHMQWFHLHVDVIILLKHHYDICDSILTLSHDICYDVGKKIEKWSWSLSLRLVYPVLHQPPGATITSRSAVRIRINFWRMVGLYISFGDWANALECWRSPSLRLVIPGIAVSPGVTHSDSRIVFVTGTVVKPQQPPPATTSKWNKCKWTINLSLIPVCYRDIIQSRIDD